MLRYMEFAGSLAFGISGGLLAVRKRFDIVGMVWLTLACAVGGGIIRDVMLGNTPPRSLRDLPALLPPAVAVVVVFVGHRWVDAKLSKTISVFDAIGLGLFCVQGARIALEVGAQAVPAALLGVVTATGGGVVRDVLAREVPSVFRVDTELESVPAAIGAGVVVWLSRSGRYTDVIGLAVSAVVTSVRLLALKHGVMAPAPRATDSGPAS